MLRFEPDAAVFGHWRVKLSGKHRYTTLSRFHGSHPKPLGWKANALDDSMGQAGIASLLREILFEIRSLRQEMHAPAAAVSPEIRDLDIEEAKKEIKAYFEDHDGQDISPTQVARDLKLDLLQVIEACERLFVEGRLERE